MPRRSARLRSSQTPEAQESTPQPSAVPLESVQERDETPANDQHVVRTPVTKKQGSQKTPIVSLRRTEAITPTTGSAPRPPREEMHPSKAHQSTTKQVDSGLVLGFNPIKKDANGNPVKESMADYTPTKSKASPAPSHFGTPGYEFKFGQDAQLSDEAKQLMERVRGEAAHIRAQMIIDKSKHAEQEDTGAEHKQGDRKFAMPKGRAGRFSDVHMAEFKKMDSIANHASSFRAAPSRFQPVTKSLKRTKSKAQLDETESNPSPSRSPAKPPTVASPAPVNKRAKHNPANDASSGRSQANTTQTEQEKTAHKPAGSRPRSMIRSSLMTPTRASMARTTSASLKAPKTTLIPSLARSPDTRALASPRTPRTDFNPRFKSSLPTLGNLKSILRRRQPLFSRDPSKIAAGTHTAAPDFNPNSLFATKGGDVTDSAPTPSPKKHVEFTPSVKSRHQLAEASPSRSKIPTTPSRSNLSDIVYPTLPTLTPEAKAATEPSDDNSALSPSIRHVRKSNANEKDNAYPELPVVTHGIAHGIGNKKRHRDEVDDDHSNGADNAENVPPADAQFEERSAKRIKATPSPVKIQPAKTPVRTPSGRMGTPASARQKSRNVLSLSRLNMLAKPKGRA
ncbi:hypothetical protein N7481_010925 [Penicillium waksmanii]|uniref:uncharacterized protein n=1 Tax=Penicillium waksmanii TaxID=69791 RepID=UPI0025481621|nr:uncharacterized protein N7481_010925 [Penicillium waksmanii]KAJ5973715.1 hypothetical protein N7481_010925 [Penicillium waksmanii]